MRGVACEEGHYRNFSGLIMWGWNEARVVNASFHLNENGTVNFFKGKWYGGVWEGGTWIGGIFCSGVWVWGDWHGGIWRNGTWEWGTWYGGTWKKGKWIDGLNANFKTMKLSPNKWE